MSGKKRRPKRIPCFMCGHRAARSLTAERDGRVYSNGENVVAFCSLRCAANQALVWANMDMDGSWHWCDSANEWSPCEQASCSHDACRKAAFSDD